MSNQAVNGTSRAAGWVGQFEAPLWRLPDCRYGRCRENHLPHRSRRVRAPSGTRSGRADVCARDPASRSRRIQPPFLASDAADCPGCAADHRCHRAASSAHPYAIRACGCRTRATASRRTDRAGYARTASDDCATRDGARPPCAGRYARSGTEADTGRARTTTDARGARTVPNRNLHPAAGSLARACRGQFDTGCYGNAATRRAGQCAVIVVRPRSGGHCSRARGRGVVSVATAEGRTEGFKLGGRRGHRNR